MRIFLIFLLFVQVLYSQPVVPELKLWATDFTNTLSPSELSTLNKKLKDYEDTTSTQLVFLMISSLQDYPIEYYTLEVAEKNKIGTSKNDNGLLFFVAKNDRKVRIEVGYGLEGAIPDALAGSIIRNVVIPHFRNNDYYSGIDSGIDAIIKAAAGEYKQEKKEETKPVSGIFVTLFIIFILYMMFFRGRRRGGIVFLPGTLGGLGGKHKSSGWGGGFGGFGGGGGGGFGGFSGGGGGFGGGGASGSW